MNRRAMRPFFPILSALILPLTLAACTSQPAAEDQSPPLEGAAIGGPFTLTDKDSKPVRWDNFKGSWRTVYFGYTFCPDACPMDVQALMTGFRKFEKEHPDLAAKVQPIFITIDPARDGPEQVGQFAAAFHPRLIGLTGTPEEIDSAAKSFAIYYAKGTESAGGYLMDHSRQAYLMDPDGKPIALLPVEENPDAVAAELAKWVR